MTRGSTLKAARARRAGGLALACAALFALPAPAEAAASSLTIARSEPDFNGRLSSPRKACMRGRRVRVLQSKPGADSTVGSDRTDRRGRWSVRKRDAAGAFYAKVGKAPGCKPVRSRKLITGVARVEIVPAGILLTHAGDTAALKARALDSAEKAIPGLPAATWSADNPGTVSVSAAGLATAESVSGSGQITAAIAGVSSNPILATIAAPADGALLISDDQIVSGPVLTDPEAEPSADSTFDVVVAGIALPEIGTIVINTETIPLVGGVVAAEDLGNGQIKLTLAILTAEEAFPDLEIDETLDLRGADVAIDPEITDDYTVEREGDTFTFTPKEETVARFRRARRARRLGTPIGTSAELGPFRKCKGETTPGSENLPVRLSAPPRFSVRFDPTLDILYSLDDELERLEIDVKPRVSIETGIAISAAFEGKIDCKAELFLVRAPLGGPLSLLVTGLIPIGVGATLEGKMNIADAGIGAKVETAGTAEAGIHCPPEDPEDDCELIGSLSFPEAGLTPTLNSPSIGDLRFEPSLSAYGYAEILVGNPLIRRFRFDVAKAKVGVKLAGSFASKTSQLAATDYRSSYKVSLDASASLGETLSDAARVLGLGTLSGLEIKATNDLANSPAGSLLANKETWLASEEVRFTAVLSQVNFFPALGPYNVERVVLVRNSAGNVTEVGSQQATAGQTEFAFEYTAPDSGNVGEFHLFVVTDLAPFDPFALELARAELAPEPAATVIHRVAEVSASGGDESFFEGRNEPTIDGLWSASGGAGGASASQTSDVKASVTGQSWLAIDQAATGSNEGSSLTTHYVVLDGEAGKTLSCEGTHSAAGASGVLISSTAGTLLEAEGHDGNVGGPIDFDLPLNGQLELNVQTGASGGTDEIPNGSASLDLTCDVDGAVAIFPN